MGYTLDMKPMPDAKDAKGLYKFYGQQVIEFTVTITSDSEVIQDGAPVYVYPVSTGIFGQGTGLGWVLRGYDGCSHVDDDTVSATLVKKDDHTGVAVFRLLVVDPGNAAPDPQNVWVSLAHPVDHTGTPTLQFDRNKAQFDPYEGVLLVPRLNSGFTLPVVAQGAAETGPAASCNNYIRYQFEVVDENGIGLPSMRVMLEAELWGSPLNDVLLYSAWESDTALALAEKVQGQYDWYADVLTDDQGYAEVYLCAKPGTQAINWLKVSAATSTTDAAPFVITAFTPQDNLDAPTVTSPVPLDHDATVPVSLDQTFDNSQQIYWYCNGQYQGLTQIGQDLKVPVFDLNTFGLYSTDYDDGAKLNKLRYIAPRVTYLGASKIEEFTATGTPPVAAPPAQNSWPPCSLPAPSIVMYPGGSPISDSLDGWPINIAAVGERLRLRIPLSGTGIATGQLLGFDVYLNGFRLPPDDDEPVGGWVGGPMVFKVTSRMQDLGYAEWLLPPLPLLGYGQMGHQNLAGGKVAAQAGDVGTLEVSYQVYPGSAQNWVLLNMPAPTPISCSQVLRVGLDTIGPDGSVPAVA
jgi:hypothetical protein